MGKRTRQGAESTPWLWTGGTKEVRVKPCWIWEVRCHRGMGIQRAMNKVDRTSRFVYPKIAILAENAGDVHNEWLVLYEDYNQLQRKNLEKYRKIT